MIETFNTLINAMDFIENLAFEAQQTGAYFKTELLLLDDGRWRVGIINKAQMELPLED
jgi:hypothetical protein